ncbi:MAG: hypothetical protein AAGD14_16545 [Planctomycetota bacterium]
MRTLIVVLACGMLGACSVPRILHRTVIDYDESVSRAQAELLLLNIARARHGRPLHFTTVSGIAATFEVSAGGSVGAEIGEGAAPTLGLVGVSGNVIENPTMSILPVQGEEFTRRVLTPLDEQKFEVFYHQGVDPGLLLRLLAVSLVDEDGTQHANGSAAFEERVAIIGSTALDVGPIEFDQFYALPKGTQPSALDVSELVEKGFRIELGEEPRLIRRVLGRKMIADFDPKSVPNERRRALHERAQRYPANFVLVELEQWRGWIKLRSFHAIVQRAARNIGGEGVLVVEEAGAAPTDALFSVGYADRVYSVSRESALAFDVLYQLFQMTVTDLGSNRVPPVTIAK